MTRTLPGGLPYGPSLRLYTVLRYALSEIDLYLLHINLNHHLTMIY
jgi:hypothetical protein